MPHRSLNKPSTNTPKSRSNPRPSSGTKRGRPSSPVPPSSPASGRSRRAKVTPKKSRYFTGSDLESPTPSESEDEAEQSGYDDGNASEALSSARTSGDDVKDVDEDDEEYASESSAPTQKRQKRTQKNTPSGKTSNQSTAPKKGEELWRPGVKTGLAPGTKVVIEKPKPRPAGKTPYRDETIHPNTMAFLTDLAENNDRDWLKMHDPDYRTSWDDFMKFLGCLQPRVMEIDETVPELPLKDIIFRIYRDIRFSPDPTPYKPYFSACWSRTGRKGPFAVYYLQIKPRGGSLIGGGLWMPDASQLAALRRDIDRKPHKIKDVLLDEGVRREFLGGIPKDAKKAVKAFTGHNSDSMLKTKPKVGFRTFHATPFLKFIDYLEARLRVARPRLERLLDCFNS